MRISLLPVALLIAGCAPPAPSPPPPPVPIPAPAPAPAAMDTTPRLGARGADTEPCVIHHMCLPYCVVRDGRLQTVGVLYDAATGDSLYGRQRLSQAFPVDSTYAGNARWFVSSEPIRTAVGTYVKYGLPRILGATDVVPVTTFRHVTVFAEPSANLRRPDVVYVPTRPGCVFQPYTHGEISSPGSLRDR
jgi:hypothetical protein